MNTETVHRKMPAYLDFYSLDRAAFADNADDRFFYVSKALKQRLDLITHLTQFGDAVIIVTGPEGSGKTTLCKRFRDYAKEGWLLCNVPPAQSLQLPEILAHSLDVRPGSSLKQQIMQWINSATDDTLLVLLIDDAQLLDKATLEQLSVCFTPPLNNRIRLILFGTAETTELIKQAHQQQILQGSTQCLELPAFTEEETRAYLMHRLEMAGFHGDNPFTETEIRAICKSAEGWPRGTNHLADLCLTEHHTRAVAKQNSGRQYTLKPSNKKSWLTAAVFLLIAALAWMFMRPETGQGPDMNLAEHPLEMPPAATTRSQQPAEQYPRTRIDNKPQGFATTAESVATENTNSPVETNQIDTQIVDLIDSYKAIEANTPETQPVNDSPPAATIAIAADDEVLTATAAVKKHQSQATVSETTGSAPAQASETALAKTDKNLPTKAADKHELAQRENWLLQQPDSYYTLQLLGSRDEQAVQRFIKKHHLPARQTAYYRGQYKGGKWFVVLYGVYPSRNDAAKHIADLPEKIRRQNPWPRPLASIHKAISANKPKS